MHNSIDAPIDQIIESSFGYHLVKVVGDGHCFYRCIAIAKLENESLFTDIRKQVHAWLKEHMHASQVSRLILECNDFLGEQRHATASEYIDKIIGTEPFPAGLPEILAASAIYGIMIRVIHQEQALLRHDQGQPPEFSDDYAVAKELSAGRTTIFVHCVDRKHINLLATDANQASEWRKLSAAYKKHKSRLGGTVRSLPELPAPLDAECDVELIDDDILESKYDDDPNDEDYQPSITSTMQALQVDPAEADTESEEQEPADKPTQCRRTSARPYSTIRRCLSIGDQKVKKRVQKMQADHLIAIEQRGPDDVRKRIKEAKRNENLPDNAAFTQIKNLPPSLQFLDIPPFVVAVTKVWDHCGKANLDKNIPSAGELCNQEKLYDARLKLRMQLN